MHIKIVTFSFNLISICIDFCGNANINDVVDNWKFTKIPKENHGKMQLNTSDWKIY